MAFIYTALVVDNIAALKALNEDSTPKRVDGVFLAVGDRGDGLPAWYRYNTASTTAEDLPDVVTPTDTIGRWFQFSGGSGGGGSSSFDFSGSLICTSLCTTGGRAFDFDSSQFGIIQIVVDSGFANQITTSNTAIQVHKWSQEPNTGNIGRIFVAAIPKTGGEVFLAVDTDYNWITINARKIANNGTHCATCFTTSQNVATLRSFKT
ncbi:hypothetical protein LC605_27800 [Nostoc sp. CHAB 5836]|uniref:hypothetical protein n=1 Tax=Nostoc sp. CHAB 5836 TaxID=2780404 RepID=UPI001E538122|nr:hypothetical protein [Nostoc sp. CHAB 5836]MCC5618824.1 hypothetical protein [Nostoc sp. CHAB 5836]